MNEILEIDEEQTLLVEEYEEQWGEEYINTIEDLFGVYYD